MLTSVVTGLIAAARHTRGRKRDRPAHPVRDHVRPARAEDETGTRTDA